MSDDRLNPLPQVRARAAEAVLNAEALAAEAAEEAVRASAARIRAVAAAEAAERAARDESRAMVAADAEAAAAGAAATAARKREQAEKEAQASVAATAFLDDLKNMRVGKELLTVYSPEYIPPTTSYRARKGATGRREDDTQGDGRRSRRSGGGPLRRLWRHLRGEVQLSPRHRRYRAQVLCGTAVFLLAQNL